jgi:hypothetical protein
MAGQDSQSRPAPIRCQQLPVRHSNCHLSSSSRHSTFVVASSLGLWLYFAPDLLGKPDRPYFRVDNGKASRAAIRGAFKTMTRYKMSRVAPTPGQNTSSLVRSDIVGSFHWRMPSSPKVLYVAAWQTL